MTKIVIIIKINKVWSWKKESCSISGEALSWRRRVFHVEISNKRKLYLWGLNPVHYSATLEFSS